MAVKSGKTIVSLIGASSLEASGKIHPLKHRCGLVNALCPCLCQQPSQKMRTELTMYETLSPLGIYAGA